LEALDAVGGTIDFDVLCDYNFSGHANRFGIKITQNNYDIGTWRLGDEATANYDRSAMSTLGFKLDLTTLAPSDGSGAGKIYSDIAVVTSRFIAAYHVSGAILKLTDPLFTAAGLLGFSTSADATIGIVQASSDFTPIQAGYTDQGDFIQVDINSPTQLGTEGGIVGQMDVYKGTLTQAESSYLTAQQGVQALPYPGLCHAVAHHFYFGDTNFPKPFGFTIVRTPNALGLGGVRENIGDDANPAALIWDVLTDGRWGLGEPADRYDAESFREAGNTLFDEGLGVSMQLDTVQSAKDFIEDVLRHIDGVIYRDPASGKRALKLVRAENSAFPLANRSNVARLSLKRPSWDDLKNVIRIRYLDRDAGYLERVEEVQDLAGIQSRGGIQDFEEIAFLGLSNAANAKRAGRRMLLTLGYPLAQLELTVNRELWMLHVGAVFRLSWEPLGLLDVLCRVTNIDGGEYKEGHIELRAVEDIFGVSQ